jgi:sphinganine-1-phosphate aldolase
VTKDSSANLSLQIVGSAPNFPFGTIDDITALSRLAIRRRVPLHVDACLGSFVLPYLEKAGYPSEPFDFRLEGVSSISCDVHKYGFAPKGTSTIMYRRRVDRRYQYFVAPDWLGGVYASPSMAGSRYIYHITATNNRPGALLAGCWASLMSQGEAGYIAACHGIVGAAKKIEREIRENLAPDLHVMGNPLTSVVAFSSKTLNIYEVGDRMQHRGWELNGLQKPPALHIACTMLTISAVDRFLQDLAEVVAEVKIETATAELEGKKNGEGDMVALYGVADTKIGGHLGIIPRLAEGFLDALYKA